MVNPEGASGPRFHSNVTKIAGEPDMDRRTLALWGVNFSLMRYNFNLMRKPTTVETVYVSGF
jgi:hypothetical protein